MNRSRRAIAAVGLLGVILAAPPAAVASGGNTIQVGQRAYDAVDTLVAFLAKSIRKSKQPMGRTAVLAITLSDQLDPNLKPYLLKRLEGRLAKVPGLEFIQCLQCETIRAFSDGNAVIVEKGITDNTFMRSVSSDLSLDTILAINLAYTGKKLELQVKSIDAGSQSIQWERNFAVRMIFLADRGLKFSLDVGPALLMERKSGESQMASEVGITISERFHGFGELGLGVSSLFSVTDGLINYASGPLLGFNINELINWYWSWGDMTLFANPGYGISKKASSLLMRGGLRINFGTYTYFNLEYQRGLLYEKESKKYPAAFTVSLGLELQ